MSLILITACCVTHSEPPIEKQHKVQLFTCEDKMAVIVDLVLASFFALIAIGIIITAKGWVDWGSLNALSTIDPKFAYGLIGGAVGLIVIDTLISFVKMGCHISRLAKINRDLAERLSD